MSNSRPRTIRRKALMIAGTSSKSKVKVRGTTLPSFSAWVCGWVTSAVLQAGVGMAVSGDGFRCGTAEHAAEGADQPRADPRRLPPFARLFRPRVGDRHQQKRQDQAQRLPADDRDRDVAAL